MNAEQIKETMADLDQYLTFTLDNEVFAINISKVREVLDFLTITKVPGMPDFLRGVINIRGNVVPVIDLRYKLGMGVIEPSVDTCIVIVEIMIGDDITSMGALADSVREVIALEPAQILPPPKLGINIDNQFIKGMGRQDDKFLMILDIDRVLTANEISLVRTTNDASISDIDVIDNIIDSKETQNLAEEALA
ncbi:MAG: purine-binding chemotaxis protein CheW [Deltaproteobacteria bacterium]|nr:purine-binding chemotaxis protein CheW [Deltaproteobacteria bacterium]